MRQYIWLITLQIQNILRPPCFSPQKSTLSHLRKVTWSSWHMLLTIFQLPCRSSINPSRLSTRARRAGIWGLRLWLVIHPHSLSSSISISPYSGKASSKALSTHSPAPNRSMSIEESLGGVIASISLVRTPSRRHRLLRLSTEPSQFASVLPTGIRMTLRLLKIS